ncbi:sigma factor-like helix-turn-helix DNA-binding protein [Pseudorhizobium flavum]|uniref:sigma factor-like helix-turn-helix DNA-binding protein n=1 Tax=Pseudorhizobium flavum TaxID=1335061 RepID=UPI00249166EB|nr:sigma factor-like helix-turn-helix DNA-binding protein [Pseudorhizobium flavum]
MAQPAASIDPRRDLVSLLPRLRRFALTLASDVSEADDLVLSACSAVLADGLPGDAPRLDLHLFAAIRTLAHAGASAKRGASVPSKCQSLVLAAPKNLAASFLLVEVEGLSYAEAADVLEISSDAVASQLCEARLYFSTLPSDVTERRA